MTVLDHIVQSLRLATHFNNYDSSSTQPCLTRQVRER